MLRNLKRLTIAAVIGVGLSGSANFASAQGITIGGDDRAIIRLIENSGYADPKITKRGLTITRVEACKGADKFLIKLNVLGIIKSQSKIGTCVVAAPPSRFRQADAEEELRRAGYRRIETRREDRSIAATACRRDIKYQLRFNRRGQIVDRREDGPCRVAGLNSDQIIEVLRRDGYRRIDVTSSRPPRYTAEACLDGERLRLELNRRGNVRSQRRIGECGRRFNPTNLANLLRDNGFDRIVINRSDRAPYLAEGCKGSSLIEVTVGRNGRIRKEERVGRCAEAVSKQQVAKKLRDQGYFGVNITKFRGGWRADVCRQETKLTLEIDAYGDVSRERNSGECRSQTILQVLKTLESRGAKNVNAVVEGCFRGTKYRWEFDRLGNRTGRDRIGNC